MGKNRIGMEETKDSKWVKKGSGYERVWKPNYTWRAYRSHGRWALELLHYDGENLAPDWLYPSLEQAKRWAEFYEMGFSA